MPSRSNSTRRPPARRHLARRRAARGFSLVEMLVAVAIVGLLVGLVGPAALRQLQSSRVTATEAQIAQLRAAIDIFEIDTGRQPTDQEGLSALLDPGLGIPGWNGPYLRDGKMPVDPWGNAYTYVRSEGTTGVVSLGADGQPGGQGNDADITG